MEMNGVKEICVLGFLGINSWIDIRKKQVSLLLIIIFAVCGTVWTIYSRRNVPEVLMCVGTLGTVLYPEEFFSTLFIGMICSAVWSGIMMMGFCRKGSTEIPFVPFLLAGYLGGFLI